MLQGATPCRMPSTVLALRKRACRSEKHTAHCSVVVAVLLASLFAASKLQYDTSQYRIPNTDYQVQGYHSFHLLIIIHTTLSSVPTPDPIPSPPPVPIPSPARAQGTSMLCSHKYITHCTTARLVLSCLFAQRTSCTAQATGIQI